jgi:ABC-type sugar transport system permease subunit
LLKLLGLIIVDAFALTIVYALFEDDNALLALVFLFITVMMNVLILVPRLYPFKWMSPGLALVILLVVYPIIYTIITALSNYSDGHLLTKDQTIELIEQRNYLPETGQAFTFAPFRTGEEGAYEYALWLVSEDGETMYFALPDAPFEEVEADAASEDGIPTEYGDYQRMTERRDIVGASSALDGARFGEGDEAVEVTAISTNARRPSTAQQLQQRYIYDEEQDAFLDQQTGTLYYASSKEGCFLPEGVTDCGGESGALVPGYRVYVGLENFDRLINDPALSGPLGRIFGWTILFSLFSVLTTFALGLFMAVILDDDLIPGRKVIRSLLIIPYAIPGVISILVWQGMLNMNLGVISVNLQEIFGLNIPWFTDPFWAKFAIILVNTWLGYPYMMLICSGALQSIPSDVYEAAAVDGANSWQRFWRITLPLLLVTVGPLLIASFTFNFNNYLIIEALTEGDPPMAGTITPAGHSDILISYTYDVAFGSDRGADYGYASAITIIIFAIVAGVTLFNYRFTRTWEEVGENV